MDLWLCTSLGRKGARNGLREDVLRMNLGRGDNASDPLQNTSQKPLPNTKCWRVYTKAPATPVSRFIKHLLKFG